MNLRKVYVEYEESQEFSGKLRDYYAQKLKKQEQIAHDAEIKKLKQQVWHRTNASHPPSMLLLPLTAALGLAVEMLLGVLLPRREAASFPAAAHIPRLPVVQNLRHITIRVAQLAIGPDGVGLGFYVRTPLVRQRLRISAR